MEIKKALEKVPWTWWLRGTIYVTLAEMEGAGLVVRRMEPTTNPHDPRFPYTRHYFSLSAHGAREVLRLRGPSKQQVYR